MMSLDSVFSSIGSITSSNTTILNRGAPPLSSASQESLGKWLAMIAKNDFRDLPSIIAADAVFHSPVGLKPYLGRDLVCLLLRTAAGVFEDFQYHREFVGGENVVLEFSAHIGDVDLKAVHIIRFNAAGEFADIEKMLRPVEAVKALGSAMASLIGPQIKVMREAQQAQHT
jgi:hypothetical protein